MNRYRVSLLLSLLGWATHLFRVDAQSLRGDESFDVLFALQPLGEIFYQDRFNQIYPPLYHTLDHFWLVLAGTSQLSARFIALAAGVVLVPLTYRLGRTLLGETAARLGALLVALHPFLIWHSQDGRMYTLLAALTLASALVAERIWRSAGGRIGLALWAAYLLLTALNILNHYFAYFAVFAINVVALLLWRRRRWPFGFYLRWFLVNALAGVVAIIWFALAWARIAGHSEPWIEPVSPLDVLARSALAYSLGTTVEWAQAWPFVAVMFGLAALGALAVARGTPYERERSALSVLGVLTALPPALIYAGSLFRPMYDEKFLIFIVPFYMLLAARGLLALGRWRWPLFAVAGAGMLLALVNYHADPRFAKAPPWRETAQAILSQAQPGDVVVYNFPDPSMPYQIGGRLPIVLVPGQGPGDPAVAKPLGPESVEPELDRLAGAYNRIWFVPQPAANWDRDGVTGQVLARFADRDYESSFGPLRLERYLSPRAYQALWSPIGTIFDDGIELQAYRAARAPGAVRLTLYWRAARLPAKNYTVFAHLLNEAGALAAQQDNPPVGGSYPTTQWAPGRTIVDRYDIMMSTDLPAGRYRFEVGLYDAGGTRLRAGNDDKVVFGEFRP